MASVVLEKETVRPTDFLRLVASSDQFNEKPTIRKGETVSVDRSAFCRYQPHRRADNFPVAVIRPELSARFLAVVSRCAFWAGAGEALARSILVLTGNRVPAYS